MSCIVVLSTYGYQITLGSGTSSRQGNDVMNFIPWLTADTTTYSNLTLPAVSLKHLFSDGPPGGGIV